MGSAGGTQYANGATVSLGANAVFYAVWVAIPAVPFYLSSKNLTYSYTEYLGKAGGYRPTTSTPYWYLEKIHGGGGTTAFSWVQDKTSSFSRQHCTKVKFKVFRADGDLIIGNKVVPLQYKPFDDDPMIVDISDQPDMISCTLKTHTTNDREEIQLYDPYFY